MIRVTIAALLALSALPLAAQDYGIALREPASRRVPLHTRAYFGFEVARPANGPEIAAEIEVPGEAIVFDGNCEGPKPIRCALPASYTLIIITAEMHTPGTFPLSARLIAPADANPANDQLSTTIEVVDAPSLTMSLAAGRGDPGRETAVFLYVPNRGATANEVVITATLPDGGAFTGATSADAACRVTPATLVCTRATLGNPGAISITATVALPDRVNGGEVPVVATVTSRETDFDAADNQAQAAVHLIPHVIVDSVADDGPGTLRQALLDAQSRCAAELCAIDFRIPGAGDGGRFVIRPRSELPEVRGNVNIDGATQTFFGGDTNPGGPEIVIDGALAPAPAHGLVLGGPSCELYVRNIAIENFSAPGIEARRGAYDFARCTPHLFPNTVIARNHLSGNYRGIAIAGEGAVKIEENVIRGNRRAGIFADASSHVEILRNRISDNGASGIFMNPRPLSLFTAGVIEENVISGNGEWGITRTFEGDLRISRNAIFANRYLGVDAGLDFETPNRAADPHFVPGVPNKPVLLSAQYDPVVNKTRVRGRLDSDANGTLDSYAVELFASSALSGAGQAQSEQWLATATFPNGGGHTDFTIEVDGDLRGKYLTATNVRRHLIYWDDWAWDTSELSEPLFVQ